MYPDSQEVHDKLQTRMENAPPGVPSLRKPTMDVKKIPFDPLE